MVRKNWDDMAQSELYKVNIDKDTLWEKYLSSFPEGSNPIFRERTEHDCSCCRQFIKNVGNVVSIEDTELRTVWDIPNADYPYNIVAEEMSAFVKEAYISNIYRSSESQYGAAETIEYSDVGNINWHHFVAQVPANFVKRDLGTILGKTATNAKVFFRGLNEITSDSLETIINLIGSKSIYKGDEYLSTVKEFQKIQTEYLAINDPKIRNIFLWKNINSQAIRFRNSVIGTLATDLSDGVDLETAVGKFEAKVAPENYKRSSALITPRMIKEGVKKIRELGLESALERRHANITDISINNVLFVDNAVQGEMKDGLTDMLMEETTPTAYSEKMNTTEISIDQFMDTIIPKISSIDMLVSNKHMGNFMSLTAPVWEPEMEDNYNLFKWNNDFAWSYDGNVTDSIKERVKKAGGNVDNAEMRFSLAWFNYDDLDIHVTTPDGKHIYYGNPLGKLDVDMNAGSGTSREAVENVSWSNKPVDGTYVIAINNYAKREAIDIGFDIQIQSNDTVTTYNYSKVIPSRKTIEALHVIVKNGVIVDVKNIAGMSSDGGISEDKWGIKTKTLVRVNTLMFSPNYWDEQKIGNKHWFFMLEGCINPEPTRGIYNEFLSSKLHEHRKVLEVLADKTKCPFSENQLSGMGFSSTRGDEVIVVVKGPQLNKAYNINF